MRARRNWNKRFRSQQAQFTSRRDLAGRGWSPLPRQTGRWRASTAAGRPPPSYGSLEEAQRPTHSSLPRRHRDWACCTLTARPWPSQAASEAWGGTRGLHSCSGFLTLGIFPFSPNKGPNEDGFLLLLEKKNNSLGIEMFYFCLQFSLEVQRPRIKNELS